MTLLRILGVGLLTANAAVVTIGHPAGFSSGRQFATWLGLVLSQTEIGGYVR
ncbi:transposase [Janthinobacterium sp. FW305-129]|uniref:transposase n=1 Tax=Janthinobacterium sp. FW305-129 TaxID=2775054 RepID=UPI001E4B4707|nr:transposase [Janthinobacterium sp. FW305-129]MCC7596402.1 transposase [Janthinobacterium sp. FW305-129]